VESSKIPDALLKNKLSFGPTQQQKDKQMSILEKKFQSIEIEREEPANWRQSPIYSPKRSPGLASPQRS
jgi:hypothetical protein